MTGQVKIATIQKIAKSKGLVFEWDQRDESFVMTDKASGEVLMTYANITVSLITNDKVWREECNKLKSQLYR